MFFVKVIREGQRMAAWRRNGRIEFLDGPCVALTLGRTFVQLVQYKAEIGRYLAIRYRDGHVEHQRGPVEIWDNPARFANVLACECIDIDEHEAVALYHRDGEQVVRRIMRGPCQYMPLPGETVETLQQFNAEPGQYLDIRFLDGNVERLEGPCAVWFDPTKHAAIDVRKCIPVDCNEAIVVYRREGNAVTRRVEHGPLLFTPAPDEWLHEFRWHGAEGGIGARKIPGALTFTKLRVIPDQMYFDVEDVRTADDALLRIKLMVFFELIDIEKMLNQTHDPVADFINALSADVIDFAAKNTFETFKERTDALNSMETYRQLAQRGERIGYRITKVVYRGYHANANLQAMHDHAIEARTELKLQAETEEQAQKLEDLKLRAESDRVAQRQQMEKAAAEHRERLDRLAHAERLRQKREEVRAEIQAEQERADIALAREKTMNAEKTAFLQGMRAMDVNLTHYLVAQYQHPDRIIRVEGDKTPQLHMHEN